MLSGDVAPLDVTAVRGIRGATTVEREEPSAVADAIGELLARLLEDNEITTEDVAAAIFTVPEELTRANPAGTARGLGWSAVPMLVVREHATDPAMPRCIRVLLLCNTTLSAADIQHAYLRRAAALRADLS